MLFSFTFRPFFLLVVCSIQTRRHYFLLQCYWQFFNIIIVLFFFSPPSLCAKYIPATHHWEKKKQFIYYYLLHYNTLLPCALYSVHANISVLSRAFSYNFLCHDDKVAYSHLLASHITCMAYIPAPATVQIRQETYRLML